MFFILFGALYFLNYVNISGLTTDLRGWVNALGGQTHCKFPHKNMRLAKKPFQGRHILYFIG